MYLGMLPENVACSGTGIFQMLRAQVTSPDNLAIDIQKQSKDVRGDRNVSI